MSIIKLNSIPASCLEIRENATEREEFLAAGRVLTNEQFYKGHNAMNRALNLSADEGDRLNAMQYKKLNEEFQQKHLLYCAKKACEADGTAAPETFEEFKRQGQRFYQNEAFCRNLQGVYAEILQPILPAVYSEAVSRFADVVEVGFGETYQLSIGSNDIPIFQDSAWGASRSVPANRFYPKDYTLNPQPKTAEIRMKWHQLVGNGTDFGVFFANIVAGMYAKTMGLWNAAMSAAASDPSLIPPALSVNFSALNWVTLANKLSAVNNTGFDNLIAYGSPVALMQVLPKEATGSTYSNMDAALAMMLGRDYVRDAQLGQYMNVRLMGLRDAVVPGTQNTSVTTVLPNDVIWMMAANGRKPLTIGYNSATPITIQIDPIKNAAFEFILNLTMSIDSVAVFSSKVGIVNL